MYEVPVLELDIAELDPYLVSASRERALREAYRGARQRRTVHHINSTPAGGGVAEMLPSDIGYAKALGADMRWHVLEADPSYFAFTKGIHNGLHGHENPALSQGIGPRVRELLREVAEENLREYAGEFRRGDFVVLHDPQTVGLIPGLRARGVRVLWRSHVGADTVNTQVIGTWAILADYVLQADAVLFTRHEHVPYFLRHAGANVYVIPPSIDPNSPKNLPTEPAPLEGERNVVQVARWDRLKDPEGLVSAFVMATTDMPDAHLYLVGPEIKGVTDDPESVEVYRDVEAKVQGLPAQVRGRVHLVTLDMADRTINAIETASYQQAATVVAQKSIQEGFGLTVTEAMWKRRLVVANAVGGIQDQIIPGIGLLVYPGYNIANPSATFVEKLHLALSMPAHSREAVGIAARRSVAERYLTDSALLNYAKILTTQGW